MSGVSEETVPPADLEHDLLSTDFAALSDAEVRTVFGEIRQTFLTPEAMGATNLRGDENAEMLE